MRLRSIILALMLGLVDASARSQDAPPPDAPLTGLGLKAEKTRYVFADAEDELREKYRDAMTARDLARDALARVEQGAMLEQGLLELQAGEEQIRAEIDATRSSTAGMSYGRNRYARQYRNQAEAAIREQRQTADQLRKQIARAKKQRPTEKQRQVAEGGARMAMDRAHQAVKDVNAAYDALVARYEEVRARDGVLEALEAVGRPKRIGYQLGPSEESDKIGKWAKVILKIRPERTTPARKQASRPVTKTDAKPADADGRP